MTSNPDKYDGYIGNGVNIPKNKLDYKEPKPSTPFRKALNKYGVNNFVRTTLHVFDSAEEAYKMEENLVTQEFIDSDNTYNLKLGGLHAKNINRKPVNQYTITGEYLKTWDSLADAAREYEVHKSNIRRCCTEENISIAGFTWRLYTGNTENIIVRKALPRNDGNVNIKSVVQYSKQGYKKRTFKSLAEAANHINVGFNGISKCCLRKDNINLAGGYQWRFESDNLESIPPYNSSNAKKKIERIENGIVTNTSDCASKAAADWGFTGRGRGIRKACDSGKEYLGCFWRFKVKDMV